jgi:hypothetical protein
MQTDGRTNQVKVQIETQTTQPTQGRAGQVSVIHTFEYVSASWEVGQGSTVLRLLSPAPRSVPDTVLQRSPRRTEQRRFLRFTRLNMSARVESQDRTAQFYVCFRLRHVVFRTQFTERVLLGNFENGRTDYRSRPTVRKYVVSELFITEFRRQSELAMSFSLFHILAFPYRLLPFWCEI